MKRILFIAHHLNRAGTEAFMMNVFRGVDHSRFRVDFLLYNNRVTDYTREVEESGSRIWRVPSRRESPWGWYSSLCRFFREHASEYVAVHYCGCGLTAIFPLVLAYKYRIPVRIAHSHSSSSNGLHNRMLHMLKRGIVKYITTHRFACSTMAAHWFFGNSPATIIQNGINTSDFAYNPLVRDEIRQQLNIGKCITVIGHVGRFGVEKNHVFLIDIFAEYQKLQPDSVLLLIGTGNLLEAAKEKVKKLDLNDKVLFLGERSDVNKLMQAMDIFLMPSTFEGQPFVLIEAQCSGLPCLVSDVINRDICLTPNVETFPLQQPAEEWARKVKTIVTGFQRKDESEAIERQGYSIANTIKFLEQVYDGQL